MCRFPGRILVGLAATLALLIGAVAVNAGGGDDLRDRAGTLESGLKAVAETEDEVVLELFALESELARAAERVDELEARAERVGDATDKARDQTRIARQSVEVAQANLAERIRTLYITDDVDSLDVFIGARSIQDAVDGIGALERAASYDARLLDQVGVAREVAIEQRDELLVKQRKVDEARLEARAARRRLAETRTERTTFLRSLRRRLELGQRDVSALRRRAVALERRAAELAAEAAAEAEALAAQQATPPPAPAVEPSPPQPPSSSPPAPSPSPSPGAAPPAPSPPPAAPPPPGGLVRGSRLTVVATSYALRGTTAVGLQTRPGIIAVDPTFIPLGTKMFVPGYGEGVAADTGSAVKGPIIDVWLPTVEEALQWGRRTVTITIR